jgi:sterol desaturase/sphingolipid hydroxylase (fatty acid hydroxylase superfamily)
VHQDWWLTCVIYADSGKWQLVNICQRVPFPRHGKWHACQIHRLLERGFVQVSSVRCYMSYVWPLLWTDSTETSSCKWLTVPHSICVGTSYGTGNTDILFIWRFSTPWRPMYWNKWTTHCSLLCFLLLTFTLYWCLESDSASIRFIEINLK